MNTTTSQRITGKDLGGTRRHIFVGTDERCTLCGSKRGFFLHNAPNSGADWAKKAEAK